MERTCPLSFLSDHLQYFLRQIALTLSYSKRQFFSWKQLLKISRCYASGRVRFLLIAQFFFNFFLSREYDCYSFENLCAHVTYTRKNKFGIFFFLIRFDSKEWNFISFWNPKKKWRCCFSRVHCTVLYHKNACFSI